MRGGDPVINNNIILGGYISCMLEKGVSAEEIRTVTVDMISLPNIELTKKWSLKTPYRIEYVNVPLPSYVLYIDPQLPMIKYITMLMERGHRFRLLDGTELNYNGSDPTGMPRFITRDRKRTYSVSSTLEYKFMVLKKTMYTIALYLATPTSIKKAAEFFNVSEHVIVEALRHLDEPRRVVVNGESQVIEWNGKRILVVHVDGTRGGGRGIVVAGSNKHEIYISGNERDVDVLEKLAKEIEELAKRENTDMYLFVIDGGRWLADFFMERFNDKCVIVEHSHITWWEISVIYKHAGEWFTIRLRDDLFVDETRSNPEIDIPPGHVEVWQGAVHVGYAKKIKREQRWIQSWKKHLNETIEAKLFHREMNERSFRTNLAWWVKRINMLTRNLMMQKEGISEFVEKVKKAVKALCTEIKAAKKTRKFAEILVRQISRLHKAYDEAKKVALSEFSAKPQNAREEKSTDKKSSKKRKRSRKKIKLVYYGPLSKAPKHAKDIIELLKKVFKGKHISNNKAESLIGLYIHSARSCRGDGKILLKLEFQRKHVADAFKYLSSHLRFGRGPRKNRPRFHVGHDYVIKYRDLQDRISERKIKVLAIHKRHITAYCYLRKDVRKFRKKGVLSVSRCQTI